MGDDQIVPQYIVQRNFHNALRLLVGQGKRHSCAEVAAATGIAQRTIESYQSGETMPSLDKYHTLCSVLGQGFFQQTIKHLPFDVRTTGPVDLTPPEVLSETIDFGAHLAKMLADGKIDHREEPQLKAAMRNIMEVIAGALAAMEGE